jgi:hypothetical protein
MTAPRWLYWSRRASVRNVALVAAGTLVGYLMGALVD